MADASDYAYTPPGQGNAYGPGEDAYLRRPASPEFGMLNVLAKDSSGKTDPAETTRIDLNNAVDSARQRKGYAKSVTQGGGVYNRGDQ